jgi:DNA modification methylase
MLELNKIYNMDCLKGLKQLDDNSINCCVTSPPYWGLRDYGVEGQFGLESTPEEYVAKMVEVFREVKRVLRKDGTLWLNLGDSYSGSCQTGGVNSISGNGKSQPHVKHKRNTNLKPKDLVGIPWMVAFALRADGWYLRQDIIWHKPNPMPESVKDRCTKAHEYIFLLSKSQHYYYDHEAISEPYTSKAEKPRNKAAEGYNNSYVGGRWSEGERDYYSAGKRNKRSVWTVATKPFKEAHFAVFPPALIEPCILAGCPENGIVLDPFMGSGTTGMVAAIHQRNFIGFELNPEYCKMAEKRIEETKAQIRMII